MTQPILFAAFGGLAVNLLSLIEMRNIPKDRRPDLGDFFYWLPVIAWPIVGSVFAFAYLTSGEPLSPVLAMNVGVSAPLLLRSMAQANPLTSPRINPGQGA